MEEIYKDIPNYQGLYQASSLGNIKSLSRRWGKGFIGERVLVKSVGGNGYELVSLHNADGGKKYTVHSLIMKTFIGESKLDIDHINGDRTDNRLENLRYCTRRQNSHYGVRRRKKYVGICWVPKKRSYRSTIQIEGKNIFLGLFKTELAASMAYTNKLREYYNHKYVAEQLAIPHP